MSCGLTPCSDPCEGKWCRTSTAGLIRTPPPGGLPCAAYPSSARFFTAPEHTPTVRRGQEKQNPECQATGQPVAQTPGVRLFVTMNTKRSEAERNACHEHATVGEDVRRNLLGAVVLISELIRQVHALNRDG